LERVNLTIHSPVYPIFLMLVTCTPFIRIFGLLYPVTDSP
jgi:hypothetical protein